MIHSRGPSGSPSNSSPYGRAPFVVRRVKKSRINVCRICLERYTGEHSCDKNKQGVLEALKVWQKTHSRERP